MSTPSLVLPPALEGKRFVSLKEAAALRSVSVDTITRDPVLAPKIIQTGVRRRGLKLKRLLNLE